MILEVYDDGTAIPSDSATKDAALSPGATLLYTIKGKDWDNCMTKYHVRQGWEPYVPF